jgi:hypothetical protein
MPLALHQVGAVDPGCSHGNEQIVITDRWVGSLLPVKPAILDYDRVHCGPPRSLMTWAR